MLPEVGQDLSYPLSTHTRTGAFNVGQPELAFLANDGIDYKVCLGALGETVRPTRSSNSE